jgi:pimeloyl-ACP methyl ester carboxylesterase
MPLVAGIYYYAHEGGEQQSPPIVLIHGAGGSHLSWPPDIRRLNGHRTYAVDLPGHGKSAEGCGQQTIEGYAANLLSWLSALGWHRAIFVGHSMGGAIALHLGVFHPEHVAGLSIIASSYRLPIPATTLEDIANPATYSRGVQAVVNGSFHPQTDARTIELTLQRTKENRPSVLYGDLLACNQFDLSHRLTEIKAPTLVLCGAGDHITPLRQGQYLADRIPRARLEIIPYAGHMLPLERPQAVAQALHLFIEKIHYQPGGQ